MKFSEKWLRELITTDVDHDALVDRLTMAGLEVEGVEPLGESLEGVIVGEIIAIEKHPQADRLQVCSVNTGDDVPVQIVCGAPNACLGLKAPLATLGTTMPNGMKIKQAKLRGIESFGMLCSSKELGLGEGAAGLMALPQEAIAGQRLDECLGLPDTRIEIGLTPNRSDCLGMYGLARDAAAILDCDTRLESITPVAVESDQTRGVTLQAGDDCPCYMGRIVEGVNPSAPTPLWMSERLRRADIRPVSLLVDIGNYVMLETGQPLHAFDNDCLQGDIVVRYADENEKMTLLTEDEVTLDSSFMVIADANKPQALAGIMGGNDSKVSDSTHTVFLESAHFVPSAIMGKARHLGLHTDSSHRFERGVDPQLPRIALERATQLLLELSGGKAGPVTVAEVDHAIVSPEPVVLRRQRLARVLGIDISDSEVERILTRLDMQVETVDGGWQAIAPSRRFDIEREEDLIEEVARIYGYHQIPTRSPGGQLTLSTQLETRQTSLAIAHQLAARNYQEAITMSFIGKPVLACWGMEEQGVALANPLTAELAIMRPSLLPGLVEAMKYNLARQQSRVRLFERGHVFKKRDDLPDGSIETAQIAWVACGNAHAEQWGVGSKKMDFFDIRGDLDALIVATGEKDKWHLDGNNTPDWMHPGRSARIFREDEPVGVIGMLHPSTLAALDIDNDVYVVQLSQEAICHRHLPEAGIIGRYPSVRRDIAIQLSQQVTWAQVEKTLVQALGSRLQQVQLFDNYRGQGVEEGSKSLAIGLVLQDTTRTLTDSDANDCVAAVVAALEHDYQATLRG